MAEAQEVDWVEIANMRVSAAKVVCPECKTLWLDTDFDTTHPFMWTATCPEGHVWDVEL